MSLSFDNPEYPDAPTPLGADTLVDSVVILLVLSVVQRLIGFVRAVFFCRWLSPEELGLWDMAFSFLLLAAPLAVLAIPGVFGRYVDQYRRRGQLHAFLRRMGLTCGILAIAAVVVVLLFRSWFSLTVFGTKGHGDVLTVAAATLLIVIAYNFVVELLTALRAIRLVSIMQLINSLAFAGLGVGLLIWQCDAKSVLAAYGGACVITMLWAFRPMRRLWLATPPAAEPMPQSMFWERVAPFAAWILLASVLSNVFGVIDRYMLLHFANLPADKALDMVGNYHSTRVVPLLLVSIATMLATMMVPHLSHDWEAGRRDLVAARLRLFLKLFGFGLCATAALVLAASPLLFGLAFRGKFPSGQVVLPWTLVYCTWFGLSVIAQNYLFCAEKARLSSVALAAGLALNVALNIVLLPRYGLTGAVLSTAAANAVSLGLICWFNRALGFHLDLGAGLVLVLPLVLCLGPWASILTLSAVALAAVWSKRLLSPGEKHELGKGIAEYAKRFGLDRRVPFL